MNSKTIVCASSLDDAKKRELAEIVVDGFADTMSSISKNKADLAKLFIASFDYSMVYSCLCNDKICGMVGIGTNMQRPFNVDKQVCIDLFGKFKGKMVGYQLCMMLEKPAVKNDTDLYIDFLTTDSNVRGQGIGTLLLEYLFEWTEYHDYYLDVLSQNRNAKGLYEKLGFEVYKKGFNLFSIFTIMQGFGSIVKMKKATK